MRDQRCPGMEQSNRLAPRFPRHSRWLSGQLVTTRTNVGASLPLGSRCFHSRRGRGRQKRDVFIRPPFWCPCQGSVTLSRTVHIRHSFIHVDISERSVCDYLTFPVGRKEDGTAFIQPMKVSSADIFFFCLLVNKTHRKPRLYCSEFR